MTFLLKSFFSLIQIIHSENGENSIASAVSFGLILGFSPLLSLQAVLIIILSLIFSIQIGAMLLSWALFSIIALMLYSPIEQIGHFVLSQESLTSFFILFFNTPGTDFTLLNNSLVMGGFTSSLFLAPFLYFVIKRLLKAYRKKIGDKIKSSKYIKLIKATKIYSLYKTYSKFC